MGCHTLKSSQKLINHLLKVTNSLFKVKLAKSLSSQMPSLFHISPQAPKHLDSILRSSKFDTLLVSLFPFPFNYNQQNLSQTRRIIIWEPLISLPPFYFFIFLFFLWLNPTLQYVPLQLFSPHMKHSMIRLVFFQKPSDIR